LRQERVGTQESARKQLEVLLEHKVPLFACAQGNPAFIIPEMHQHGVKVLGTTADLRRLARELGLTHDVIVTGGGRRVDGRRPWRVPRVSIVRGGPPLEKILANSFHWCSASGLETWRGSGEREFRRSLPR
jgi:hypothetical protein